jgi:hypothetical protein
MIKFLKNIFKKEPTPLEELSLKVLDLLKTEPEKWKYSECTITYNNKFSIWIENRPYADISMHTMPLKKQKLKHRKKIRNEIDKLIINDILKKLN